MPDYTSALLLPSTPSPKLAIPRSFFFIVSGPVLPWRNSSRKGRTFGELCLTICAPFSLLHLDSAYTPVPWPSAILKETKTSRLDFCSGFCLCFIDRSTHSFGPFLFKLRGIFYALLSHSFSNSTSSTPSLSHTRPILPEPAIVFPPKQTRPSVAATWLD